MIYTNWLNQRDTYIKQLQDINSQLKNDIGRCKEHSEDFERELTQTKRTKDELLRSEQHYRMKTQQLEALKAIGSSVNVTEERYAGTIKKMGDEMGMVKAENQELHQQYEKEHLKVQRLEGSLDELNRQYATLLNQQPYGTDYRTGLSKYNQTSNASGTGSGLQGRDCGVPYPKN